MPRLFSMNFLKHLLEGRGSKSWVRKDGDVTVRFEKGDVDLKVGLERSGT